MFYSWRLLRSYHLHLLVIWSGLFFTACTPTEPEMISVTEIIPLGDEQIIITRLVELTPVPTATPEPPAVQEQPVALDLAYEGDLPQLDPQQAVGKESFDLVENLFIGLTRFNHETQHVEPQLAESWTVTADGRTWTFNLRDDIQWIKPSDPPPGENETWELESVRAVQSWDVVRAIERVCSRDTGTPDAFIFFIIEGCEEVYRLSEPTDKDLEAIGARGINATQLEITLTQPASHFLTMTSLPQIRPVPGDLLDEHGASWRTNTGDLADGWHTPANIVTSGPFIPSATVFSDEGIVLHKNPLWPINRQGNVDIINIDYQQQETEIFEAWRAKLLDLSPLPIAERESFLSQTSAKARLITNQTVFYLGYNFDSVVFSEPEVRRAFAAAVDRTQLVEDMFDGRAQELRHLTPPGVFGAPPVDEVGVGYSPDYARLQMDRSSFRNCKLIPPITFLVSTADLSLLQAELIRRMWKTELECNEDLINIVQGDFGSLLANTAPEGTNRPDMWELAWPPTYPDAHNLLTDLLHCSEGENRQNRACSDVDRLLRQANLTPQIEERQELYRQAENLFFAETGLMPLIPLYVRGDYILVQTWLNHTPALSGGEQFDTYLIDEELKRLEQSRGQG